MAMDAWWADYAHAVPETATRSEDVGSFRFIGGGPGAMARRDILLLSSANHGTYHRGNVAA